MAPPSAASGTASALNDEATDAKGGGENGGGKTIDAWVWAPVKEGQAFEHPSDIPLDAATARQRFGANLRGPRLARLQPAQVHQQQGAMALITDSEGKRREVPKSMVLPWLEGLLCLNAVRQEGAKSALYAEWCGSPACIKHLDSALAKIKELNGGTYVHKRLLQLAITGPGFLDDSEKEWSYRRDTTNSSGRDISGLPAGEDSGSVFRIKEILDYKPPWEAFCDPKCGFYQDFYAVKWEGAEHIDHSAAENGGPSGTTWEPDECLPAQLDPLRLKAKKAWVAKAAAKKKRGPPAVEEKGVEKKTCKRNGQPLEKDAFQNLIGHDFAPELAGNSKDLRRGWPTCAREYPKGYTVAMPPGFCFEGCDCMDDQRAQQAWEVRKGWLFDVPGGKAREAEARASVEMFAQQANFVRRRGQVSNLCFFETSVDKTHDTRSAKAAVDLASFIGRKIAEVCLALPLPELSGAGVAIPASAFVSDHLDLEPFRFHFRLANGSALPPWLTVDESTGVLAALSQDPPGAENGMRLQMDIIHSEGRVVSPSLRVIAAQAGAVGSWTSATEAIADRFGGRDLEQTARGIMCERLEEIYDSSAKAARHVPLATWMRVAAWLVRMLRTHSVAHVLPVTWHGSERGR